LLSGLRRVPEEDGVNEIIAGLPKEDWIQRQPLFVRERALKKLMPNASSLETLGWSEPLAQGVKHWGLRHHISDAWCLDDALAVLREFDVMEEKAMALALLPDGHYFVEVWKRAWQAAATERRLCGLHGICESSMAVEEQGGFSFTFRDGSLKISVSGPFYKPISAFRREVNDRFREAGGTKVRGARKQLDYLLKEYLASVAEVTKKLDLTAPRNWRKLEEHLRWLVDYQIPPCKTYREIARNTQKNEKTIREAIHRSACLIGLTLRSNADDKKLGRPQGSKDKKPRNRVDHRKQKVRGFAS